MLIKNLKINKNFVILLKNFLKLKIVEGKIESKINFKFFRKILIFNKKKTVSLGFLFNLFSQFHIFKKKFYDKIFFSKNFILLYKF